MPIDCSDEDGLRYTEQENRLPEPIRPTSEKRFTRTKPDFSDRQTFLHCEL